jgi:hypothetical protein
MTHKFENIKEKKKFEGTVSPDQIYVDRPRLGHVTLEELPMPIKNT